MTSESIAGGPLTAPEPRAHTLKAQRLVNSITLTLLRTPMISRAIGKHLVTLYIIGRKSGRRYNLPVAYTADEGDLLVGTPFGWGRNLRTGDPVEIRLKGRKRLADVKVLTDEPGVTAAYAIMCRDNHNFAKFQHVSFDADGNPEPRDLHLAWAAGARAFRLTPR
jgi:F420H(2)-dependent quinone reductase